MKNELAKVDWTLSNLCRNCGSRLSGNFCQQCGQRTSTHRFQLNGLILQDFLSGVFQWQKGIGHTILGLLTRPGHTIREYIEGKRKIHGHYLTLLLILLTLSYVLAEYSSVHLTDIMNPENDPGKDYLKNVEDFSNRYPKLFMMLIIPMNALMSWLFFKKAGLYYGEHLVINTYKTSGEFLITLPLSIASILTDNLEFLRSMYQLVLLLSFAYSTWLFTQYFQMYYRRLISALSKAILATLSMQLAAGLLTIVASILYGRMNS